MSQLKVVWRDSRTAKRERRWHELACDVGRKLYVVEELVPLGDQKRWAQAVALENRAGWPSDRTTIWFHLIRKEISRPEPAISGIHAAIEPFGSRTGLTSQAGCIS